MDLTFNLLLLSLDNVLLSHHLFLERPDHVVELVDLVLEPVDLEVVPPSLTGGEGSGRALRALLWGLVRDFSNVLESFVAAKCLSGEQLGW